MEGRVSMHMKPIWMLALLAALATAGDEEEAAAKAEAAEISKRMAHKDPGERLEAARAAARNQHLSLATPLAKLLKDKDQRVRVEAITSLGLRDDPKAQKKAATALGARIRVLEGKEEKKEELVAVLQALHDLAHPAAIKPLMDGIPADPDPEVLRGRLMAVANTPTAEAVDKIINFASAGGKKFRRQKGLAREAIQYATCMKQRWDVDEWRSWWKENKTTFDFDATAEKRAEMRVAQQEKAERRKNKKKRRESDG
jgi:hypothetical protein